MRYNIYSQDKIDFPEICSHCLNETEKKIYMDLEEQRSAGTIFIGFIAPFMELKHVGTSVGIPLCSECSKKLIGTRVFVLFVLLIAALLSVYGMINKMSDLGLYSLVGGIFLGIFCPFLYLMLKDLGVGVSVTKDDQGYCYSFDKDYYPEYLKKNAYIEEYEIQEILPD